MGVQYSQSVRNQMMHQNQQNNFQQNMQNNAAIVLVDHAFISPQIQQIQHNPIHSQPFFNIPNNTFNNDVIDLTGNEDVDGIDEEEKEEFVPWKDEDIPNEFKCPISLEIMSEPVICSDGFWYQRDCILDWLQNHNRSPMTNLELQNVSVTRDHMLEKKIKEWIRLQWKKYGDSNEEMDNSSTYSEDNNVASNEDFEMYQEEEEEEEEQEEQDYEKNDKYNHAKHRKLLR